MTRRAKPWVRRAGALAAVLITAGVVLTGLPSAASAAHLAPPASDPFYAYSAPLRNVAPGTVLRTRHVTVALADKLPLLPATQVLYRTTNQLGQPSATAATILRPLVQIGRVRLVSYQTAYDGLASTCRPSYQLRGGTPTESTLQVENLAIVTYLTLGFTVVTSDYEGPTDDYGPGREEGYNTLDGIRAAEHALRLAQTAKVGLFGYSGGAIASMWAAQLQPSYAPELHVVGVAAGGIAADFAHNLDYIDGSADWAGAIPAVGIGLARGYHLKLDNYLSARGRQVVAETEQGCLVPNADPGLTFADLLKPRYKNWQRVPVFVKIFNDTIMGRGATPREPLYLGVGNADGTGDGVMVAKDDRQLAHQYCARGVRVQFHVYRGLDHIEAAIPFEAQAALYLAGRFGTQRAGSNCAAITAGNPLTPLPTP